jgi:hypothetical protein
VLNFPFGVGAALASERDQFEHGRIGFSERQLGHDETGLEPGEGETVRQPELRVVPAVARGARRVSAAASGEHDELASAEQSLATLEVDGEAGGHDMVDPCLDRARRAEVVQRQAEQNRVCL